MVVGGEVYMRVADMFPTNRRVWASEFIPTLGWRFKPGAEVVWTNGINYWSRSRVNSIGFLDKEPILPKPSGTFRVMIVGDSMVQAVEVALDKRLQVRLAELLQKSMAPRAVDVVALGYSGTGQSNQLPFFEHFKDQLNPDLLILVIASNDLANNSPLLEAIRYGWHPEHLPRVFFRKRSDGSCSRIPIDPSWERHILPAGSEFDRLQKLREMSSDYKAKLEGWNPAPSEVASLDFVFFNPGPLPPAFEEAVALTRCSFQEWKRLAEREGLPLIAVAAPGLTGTESDKTGYLQRVLSILDESKIPLLNLYPEFVKRGNVPDAHLKFDGHWTVTGHRWAAEAISDYLGREGYLERRSR
jgi:lysophospholipase L1-like esterase